jgi:DNA repair protein RadD
VDTSSLHLRGGEFLADEVEELMDTDTRVKAACSEIIDYTHDRHAVLIFASGIAHGKHIQRILQDEHRVECGFVSGDSPDGWRRKMIEDFKSGALKYLCNVNVLTTGFDAPHIDCIVLLRPTMSPGLYCQMLGRGLRLHENKTDCLVLDFGGNILRHGPVDALRVTSQESQGEGTAPAKECPECSEVIAAAYARCPQCGYEFPTPDKQKHDTTASSEGVLSDQVTFTEHAVEAVYYNVHAKKKAEPDAPKTLRVQYKIGLGLYVSEWVCFEHEGFARKKAEAWWKLRSAEPVPTTSEEATDIAQSGGLAEPTQIVVKHTPGEKFDRIVNYELSQPVPMSAPEPEYVPADDDIPF